MVASCVVLVNLQENFLGIIVVTKCISIDQYLGERVLSPLLGLGFSLVHRYILAWRFEFVDHNKYVFSNI